MACSNIGSRALQMLVPHIASQRLTGKQITNPQDAVVEDILDTAAEEARKQQKQEQEEAKKAQQKAERYVNRKNHRANNNNADGNKPPLAVAVPKFTVSAPSQSQQQQQP